MTKGFRAGVIVLVCSLTAVAGCDEADTPPVEGVQADLISPSAFVLEQENGAAVVEPTWLDIEAAVSSIDLESNSFFVLSNDNGYVQTAGSADQLTVEHRSIRPNSYSHYRIGVKPLAENLVPIRYSGGNIRVRQSEVLSLEDCLAIFKSFYEHGKIPEKYHLRELGDDFL